MSYAGLLGGAVYVNAFTLISRHVDPLMREFSLAAASLGDSLGIAFADVAGVLIQVSAYSLTAVMNSNTLWCLDWKEACEGFALPVCFGLKSVLHYLKAGYAAYEPQIVTICTSMASVCCKVYLTEHTVDCTDNACTDSESE